MAGSSKGGSRGCILSGLVLLFVGFWAGLLVTSHLDCHSAISVAVPYKRAPGSGGSPRAVPGSDDKQLDMEAMALMKVVEQLRDVQQQAAGPDDDDASVAMLAEHLQKKGGGREWLLNKIQAEKESGPGGNGNGGGSLQAGHGAAQAQVRVLKPPPPPDAEQSAAAIERAKHVQQAMAQLKLEQMLDRDREPAEAIAAAAAAQAKPKEEEKVPDYLLNTMKDEPPYGTPPDPNPKPNPRVFGFVLTTPKRHDPKAIAVNLTWGGRFDGLEFMTAAHYPGLPTVVMPIKDESRSTLWPKIKMCWLRTYEQHLDQYDWFMKADDDSFVMVENLRLFLAKYDPEVPHFFGRRFLLHRGEPKAELSYHSGGAGYVLSRGALRKLGDNAIAAFSNNGLAEDVEMARSLLKLGIGCDDTRDEEGRETFLPLNIDHLRYKYTHQNKPYFWYWRYSYYPTRDGMDCCSKRWISTHYMYSKDIYRLEQDYIEGRDGRGKDPTPLLPPPV